MDCTDFRPLQLMPSVLSEAVSKSHQPFAVVRDCTLALPPPLTMLTVPPLTASEVSAEIPSPALVMVISPPSMHTKPFSALSSSSLVMPSLPDVISI